MPFILGEAQHAAAWYRLQLSHSITVTALGSLCLLYLKTEYTVLSGILLESQKGNSDEPAKVTSTELVYFYEHTHNAVRSGEGRQVRPDCSLVAKEDLNKVEVDGKGLLQYIMVGMGWDSG